MKLPTPVIIATVVCAGLRAPTVQAVTTVFFSAGQTTNPVVSGATSETISTDGYLFTYSLDKWWSATGLGPPTGRFQSLCWPAGLDAQTQTAGPTGPLATQLPATITIQRVDGQTFDLTTFSAKIFGNTGGAGAAFEIMPLLNGNDGFANPLTLDCTGYAGATFTYNTPTLTGFDTYNISMWMDYGLLSLTVVDASRPPELVITLPVANSLLLAWPTNATGYSLQQNTHLGTTNWGDAAGSITIVDTNYQANLPTTNGIRFFRLMRP